MPKRSRPRCVLLNWRDFLADPAVASMSPAALGAYVRLMGVAWEMLEPGVLPDRDDRLSVWSRMHGNWWRVRPAVSLAFDVASRPGFWLQRRLIEEHANATRIAAIKRANALTNSYHQTPTLVPPSDAPNSLIPNGTGVASVERMLGDIGHRTIEAKKQSQKIESKDAGAPRADAPTNGHLEAVAGMVGALAESLSMTRTAPRAPLMTSVRAAVAAMSKTDQGKLYQLAGWLSKQIGHDECLMRVVDDAIPRIKTSSIGNLFAYYSKDGLARCRIEGHFRADAQDNESKHWKDEEWKAAKLFRAINGTGGPR